MAIPLPVIGLLTDKRVWKATGGLIVTVGSALAGATYEAQPERRGEAFVDLSNSCAEIVVEKDKHINDMKSEMLECRERLWECLDEN